MLIASLDDASSAQTVRAVKKYLDVFPDQRLAVVSPHSREAFFTVQSSEQSRLLVRKLQSAPTRREFLFEVLSQTVVDDSWKGFPVSVVAGYCSQGSDFVALMAAHPRLASLEQTQVLIRSVPHGDQLVVTQTGARAEQLGHWLAEHVLNRQNPRLRSYQPDQELLRRCDDDSDVICLAKDHAQYATVTHQLSAPMERITLFWEGHQLVFALVGQFHLTTQSLASVFPMLYWGGRLAQAIVRCPNPLGVPKNVQFVA